MLGETHCRHAELDSASMPHRLQQTGYIQLRTSSEAWTLKQVQGDET
jgi:hypothetical protein